MRIATLTGVDVPSRRFTYTLSVPYFYHTQSFGMSHESKQLDIFSREDFTKVWSVRHTELIKTLGVKPHAYVLEELGYIRAVDPGFVQACTDEKLLTCLEEFKKTGDDVSPFEWELSNR